MLEIRGLTKRFGGIVALDGVAMSVARGRVHALLGENGAGKSTLFKCLSGVHAPDAGEMFLDGRPFAPQSPIAAETAGLRFVHQELNLVPGFSAFENAFVGRRYPRRAGLIDWRAMRRRFAGIRDRYGLDVDIDVPVGRLSTAKCQLVEILRALMDEARLLVLDEPTASLSEAEAETLHGIVRRLAAHGCAMIFVSHRLDEVFAVADEYTVLRNGRSVGSGTMKQIDRDGIVALMAGEGFRQEDASGAINTGAAVLQLSDIRPSPVRAGVDMSVAAGEIVGLYGIVGSGRSSLLKTIWGANPLASGEIRIDGSRLPAMGIGERIRAGVAYVPEDRRTKGLVMHHPILDNALLPSLSRYRVAGFLPVVNWRAARIGARAMLSERNVKYGRLTDPVSTLSGGNQQKVMIGRWLAGDTRLFLLDEPTRGVDVRSKAEIHALCRRLAENGAAVVLVTSDIEELLMLATRIVVMAQGRVTLDMANQGLERQTILGATFSAERQRVAMRTVP
ncbi:sugar ABC transporter ATP-binding protein [Nitratireductor mangrovi]|uniref:Sugar ABC transporter ATP-binding protein n=1 Tax=Nitratireductor mangrovi TaxID=2599600 RepID=A0A5B8KX04_9HYPH|nr:sugar ABC transporter ATP-binding protein [Nitratireductor mangrovi]QDZ00106.1 sugar ABC transporter ATP-binding protein [Nitratireductor mangrovi]